MASSAVVGILRALLTADTAQFQSGLKSASSAARAWQKDFASIGRQATDVGKTLTAALTVPILGLGAAATKAFIDFEDSFAGVRKTVDASEPEFAALAKAFRDLSKEIPININELNKLGETAGALGIPKAALLDFTKTMALLGVTTNVTSQQAAESIAKIQNVFGAAGRDTERFASTLVALGNNGASTEQEILALATRIASAGNTIGLSQGQVLGFAAAIANVGMEAEAGGSAISRVFTDISMAVSKGGEAVEGFAKVAGMSAAEYTRAFKDDAAGATLAFVQGLGKIKQSGGDLNTTISDLGFTELRQSDLLRRLAGDSVGLENALKMQGTAWSENTALTAEAEKRFATMKSQLQLLWNQLQDIGIELGAALMPAMKSLLAVIKDLLPYIEGAAKWFADLSPGMQTTIIGALGITAAVGPLLILFGSMATGAATLIGLFTKKGIAMRLLGLEAAAATPLAAGFWRAVVGPVGLALAAIYGLEVLGQKMSQFGGLTKEQAGELGKYDVKLNDFRRGNEKGAQVLAEVTEQVKGLTSGLKRNVAEGLVPNIDLTGKAAEAQAAWDKKHPPIIKNLNELTDAQKKHNEEIRELANQLSGKSIQKDVDDLAEALRLLGGVGRLSVYQLRELGETLTQKVSQGAVLTTSALQAVWLQHEKLNPSIKTTVNDYKALIDVMNTVKPIQLGNAPPPLSLPVTLDLDVASVGALRDKFGIVIRGLGEAPEFNSLGDRLLASLGRALEGLGGVIVGAIQGGGNVARAAFASIGSSLGGDLGASIQKALGGSLGKIVGGFAGPLGALLGGALGGLADKVFGGNNTKKARDAFAESLGLGNAAGLYDKLRTMGDEGAKLVNEALSKIGKNDTAANNAWMQSVQALIDKTKAGAEEAAAASAKLKEDAEALIPTWDEAGALAEKYGIDLASLGDKFQQGGLNAQTEQLYTDFERLAAFIGEDMNEGVLRGMSDEISAAVQKALEFGGEVPKQMQPMIAKLQEMGLLLDENGNKIEGVENLKFGETMQETTLALIKAMKELAAIMRGDVTTAAEETWGAITKGTTANISAMVKSDVANAAKEMRDVATGTKAMMQADMSAAIDAVGQSSQGLLVDMASVFESTVGPAVGAIGDSAMNVVAEMTSMVKGDMSDTVDMVGFATENVLSNMADIMQGDVTDAVESIADAAGRVVGDLRDMFSAPIAINFDWDASGAPSWVGNLGVGRVPGFAKGTRGEYVDFGAGTLAMLHGRERVVPEGELVRQHSGGPPSRLEIPVHMEGSEVSRIIYPHLVQILNDVGV